MQLQGVLLPDFWKFTEYRLHIVKTRASLGRAHDQMTYQRIAHCIPDINLRRRQSTKTLRAGCLPEL